MSEKQEWKCSVQTCEDGPKYKFRSWLVNHIKGHHPAQADAMIKALPTGRKAPWQDKTGGAKANPERIEKEKKRLKTKTKDLEQKRASSKFVEDRMPTSMLNEWEQRSQRLRNMANGLSQEADKIDALAAGLKKFICG